jgi:predicted DNA-binding protein (UPF0278 family)
VGGNMAKKLFGNNVRVQIYVPPAIYAELKKFAPEYETRWEAAVFRRIIHEWLETQKKKGL